MARTSEEYWSLKAEIQELLIKGVIAIDCPCTEQFTSRLPENDGSLRPVIKLKPQNQFTIQRLHFKTERGRGG